MPVRVDIPVRLKVDVPALTERRDDIEDAVAAATGRALRASSTEVLEPRGGYAGARLNEPEFTWWGDGLGAVSPTVRADVEDAVRAAIEGAARGAGLPRAPGDGASMPLLKPPAAPIDDDRYDALFGLYELPVYDRGGAGTNVAVRRRAGKRRAAAPHEPHEWWPLTPAEAQTVYSWTVEKAGIVAPSAGYMGAIYFQTSKGMTIDVVKYPAAEFAFSTSGIGLSELVADDTAGTLTDKPATQLPAVSTYWLEPIATKADGDLDKRLRDFYFPIVRELLKPKFNPRIHSEADFTKAVEARVTEQIDLLKADPDFTNLTGFMHLRIDNSSFLVRVRGAAPPSDMKRARLIPLVRPSGMTGGGVTGAAGGAEGTGAGAEGEGIEGAAAEAGGAKGTGATGIGVKGGVAGAKPVTSPPAFIQTAGPSTTGSLFPPTTGDTVAQECKSYLGEPSMDKLGADGKQMQRVVDSIAWRLQIKPCKFAGWFLLNAAEALGGRAGQVQAWDVQDKGGMETAPPGGGNVGNVVFIPTVGPQIQFMRHLASVVPLISELKDLIDRVYRERGDLIEGTWKGQPLSWLNRWKYDFVVKGMERHVGLLFVMTCNVIYRQLLNTSKENIDKRINKGFLEHFRLVILPQLIDIDDLLRARELLKNAESIEYVLRYGPSAARVNYRDVEVVDATPPAAAPEPQTWADAIEGVLNAIAPLAETVPPAERYQLIRQEGGSFRIRDKHRRVWQADALEMTITMRRGQVEEIEPLVKQFTDLPEIVERFRGLSDADTDFETYRVLDEMREKNKEKREEAKEHPWSGFRASTIIENLRGASVPKTNYALQGIHKQAHDMIGEFFRGDPFYGLAIEDLFAGELGRKELASALEFSVIVLLSVVCPPAAAAVGLAQAVVHYHEAEERRDIYKALINPEEVLSAAEVEAGMFAAKLGLVLAIIPVGMEVGAEVRAMGQLVERAGISAAEEATAVGGRVAIRTMSRAAVHLERVLKQGIVEKFAKELAENWLIDKLTGAVLDPIMQGLQEEWGATGPIGGMDKAMERLVQLMKPERLLEVDVLPTGGEG